MANGTDDDYMIGPTSELRIKLQVSFLSILLLFGILTNGSMLTLLTRFRRLRTLTNYLLIDLTIVEFLDVVVNVPIFMEFFLLTKKKNLDRQTRWFAMLFHRFFLINDLFTQLALSFDCFLAILFGRRFTGNKTHNNIIVVIVSKWAAILGLLLVFSIPKYKSDEETVSDEAYQRLLFGPSQIIWKTVIPSSQAAAVVLILMTNYFIIKSRNDVSVRYGMKVFGKGIKNNSKAVNTLFIIMVVQTLCKVPASVYSYIAVDDRVEGNRWFAFMAYYCLFLSSSIMPVIYFTRSEAFKRSLVQLRKHPFSRNAYLDFAAYHGYTHHRNGRLLIKMKKLKKERKDGATFEQPEVTSIQGQQERSLKKSRACTIDDVTTEGTTKQTSCPSSDLIEKSVAVNMKSSFVTYNDNTERVVSTSDNKNSDTEKTPSTSDNKSNDTGKTASTFDNKNNDTGKTASTSDSKNSDIEKTPSTSDNKNSNTEKTASTFDNKNNDTGKTASTSDSKNSDTEKTPSTSDNKNSNTEKTASTFDNKNNDTGKTASTSDSKNSDIEKTPSTSDNNNSDIIVNCIAKSSAQASVDKEREKSDTDGDDGTYVVTRMIVNVQIHRNGSVGPPDDVPSPQGNIPGHSDGDPSSDVPKNMNDDCNATPERDLNPLHGNELERDTEADNNSVTSNREPTMLDNVPSSEDKPSCEEFDTHL